MTVGETNQSRPAADMNKRDDALQKKEAKSKKQQVATLRKAAEFMKRLHKQSCLEQGYHPKKIVTYYGLACDALQTIYAALTPTPVADSQPADPVVNAPEYICTFPQCGCVAKGQWCPVPCTAVRKAALLDAGYDTAATDPAAIREAALQDRIEKALDEREQALNACEKTLDERDEALAKLAKAVEALRFYGNEDNYKSYAAVDPCGCCSSWYEPKIHIDGEDSGGVARKVLAELEAT